MENNTTTVLMPEIVTNCNTDQIQSPTAHFSAQSKKKRIIKPLKKHTNRQIAADILLKSGELSQSQIAEQLNYTVSGLKTLKQRLDKTSLVTSKRLKKAYKVVDNILDQKPLEIEKVVNGEITTIKDYPSHSVALDAAKRVIDQHQPIIQRHQTESININLDGTLLDYSHFQDR